MFSPNKSLPPPPSARPRNESLAANMPSYRTRPAPNAPDSDSSGFSFTNTKSMFESLNKPKVRSTVMNVVKNPTVQRTAVTVAKDERVRNMAVNAAKNPETRQTAMNVAQSPAGRGTILEMAKQFENKPLMGIAPPSGISSQVSWETAPPARQPILPSLTGDPSWNNSSRLSREGSQMSPGYSTGVSERPRSTDPSLNTLIDELFPVNKSTKNVPPARPPPPKLGSRSIPNLSGIASSGFEQSITDPHGIVKYPYKSGNFDELNCEPHDTVLLKREVDDQWIYGTNTRTGQSGIVPINFLHIKIPLVPTQKTSYGNPRSTTSAQSWSSTPASNPLPSYNGSFTTTSMPSYNDKFTSNSTTPSSYSNQPSTISNRALFGSVSQSTSLPSSGFTPAPHIARALYDYDTGVEGDLVFKRGENIIVHERINEEWYRGEINSQTGIFPINYVDVPDLNAIPMKTTVGNALADSLAKLSFKPRFVTAMYNYCSGVPEDLVFEEGDVIQVVENVNDEWIKGMLDGRTGLVPLTYVQENE